MRTAAPGTRGREPTPNRQRPPLRVAIIGNAGSGKTTLARRLMASHGVAMLDLDTVAWKPDRIAVARPPAQARALVENFCGAYRNWIVEGCYASLIAPTLVHSPHLLFLDPGCEQCVLNCRARPWEPHKYRSLNGQNERLAGLIDWVRDYYVRDGELSRRGHQALFDAYRGPKQRLTLLPGADFQLQPDFSE